MNKPKEYWLQNTYLDCCSWTKVSAFDPETNPSILTETHVIEYAAYQKLEQKLNKITEALRAAAEYHNTDDVNGEAGYIAWKALKEIEDEDE